MVAAMLLGAGNSLAAKYLKLDSFDLKPDSVKITPRQRFDVWFDEIDNEATEDDIKLSISPKDVAALDDDWIGIGKKVGKATITVQARNGKGKDVINVEVVQPGKGYTLNLAADKKALASFKTVPPLPDIEKTYASLDGKAKSSARVKPFLAG